MPKFPSIPSSPNFFQLQSEVLKYREENKIFEDFLQKFPDRNEIKNKESKEDN
jgi:hypothetical protein